MSGICCFCDERVTDPDIYFAVPPVWLRLYFHRECFVSFVGFPVPTKSALELELVEQPCQVCWRKIERPTLPVEIVSKTPYVVMFRFCPPCWTKESCGNLAFMC